MKGQTGGPQAAPERGGTRSAHVEWHAIAVDDTLPRAGVDPAHGLCNRHADRRLAQVGPAVPASARPRSPRLLSVDPALLSALAAAVGVATAVVPNRAAAHAARPATLAHPRRRHDGHDSRSAPAPVRAGLPSGVAAVFRRVSARCNTKPARGAGRRHVHAAPLNKPMPSRPELPIHATRGRDTGPHQGRTHERR